MEERSAVLAVRIPHEMMLSRVATRLEGSNAGVLPLARLVRTDLDLVALRFFLAGSPTPPFWQSEQRQISLQETPD